MKTTKFILLFFATVFIFSSCFDDECNTTREVYTYEPVFLTLDEINNAEVKAETSRELKNPGKVFYVGNTLYISETGEGVHVIDNSDKSNPVPISFIEIPGNVDVSFKNGKLFADSYFNILVIDVDDPLAPTIESRIEDVKRSQYYFHQEKDAFIVDYEFKTIERNLPCNHPFFDNPDRYYYNDYTVFTNSLNSSFESGVVFDASTSSANGGSGSIGVAGSLSSFAIVGDHFYFISGPDVNVYNIEDLSAPFFTDGFNVDWNIETLFPYQDKLFIGGQNGMYIYDNSNPSEPVYLSEFVHARACDPVFVDGTTAYVTLSDGNFCANFTNQLDVIDVSDILNPVLIKSYEMYKPKGLSVHDNTLFLCDEKAGIKIFDVEDKEKINENKLSAIQGHTFIEVIHTSATTIMGIGPEGIFQFDVSDAANPIELSHMAVQ